MSTNIVLINVELLGCLSTNTLIILLTPYSVNNNQKIGKFGENIALRYLLRRGYIFLAKNHKERFYEFDIIVKDRAGILIFVEVKTKISEISTPKNCFSPEDNLTKAKLRKLIKGTNIFIAKHPWLIDEEKGWQIDLIAVTIIERRRLEIRHYKNI